MLMAVANADKVTPVQKVIEMMNGTADEQTREMTTTRMDDDEYESDGANVAAETAKQARQAAQQEERDARARRLGAMERASFLKQSLPPLRETPLDPPEAGRHGPESRGTADPGRP